MDEMKIREQLTVKNNKLYGPVNLGFNDDKSAKEIDDIEEIIAQEEEEPSDDKNTCLPPVAKNCLVFMLVIQFMGELEGSLRILLHKYTGWKREEQFIEEVP